MTELNRGLPAELSGVTTRQSAEIRDIVPFNLFEFVKRNARGNKIGL
jgi:hypothetical protein